MLREFTPHVWQELRVVGELVGKVFTYEANVVGLFAEEVDIRVVALLIGEESRVESGFAECRYYAFLMV